MAVSRAQSRSSSGGEISFLVALDEFAAALGGGMALPVAMQDMVYTDALIDVAFKKADEAFTTEAIAMGKAGTIAHMFEWGTLGINKSNTNARLPPTNPNARLWTNFNAGRGLDRMISFRYRPSLANVPKPTVGETGMSSETIAKMKNYVFRWKAEVMEEGHYVNISPKRRFLLIPAFKENRPYMRPNDIKRGYMLITNSTKVMPGRKYYGNFTNFWETFWTTTGVDILQSSLERMILEDFTPEISAPRTIKTYRPVGSFEFKKLTSTAGKKALSNVTKKARERKAGEGA